MQEKPMQREFNGLKTKACIVKLGFIFDDFKLKHCSFISQRETFQMPWA